MATKTPAHSLHLELVSLDQTLALARQMGDHAKPGLCIALSGNVGAGKSTFARALIQHLMAQDGAVEDVPSPTFTLVQTYQFTDLEVWHADLYRIGHPDEVVELGLLDALNDSLCLIEWPDRLGEDLPSDALHLHLKMGRDPGLRHCTLSSNAGGLLDMLERDAHAE